MFRTLLKYDFKSLRRYCIPLLIVILAAAVFASVCMPVMINSTKVEFDTVEAERTYVVIWTLVIVFSIFGFIAALMLIFFAVALFQIMICVDFYKTLVTDEGYLTFTLPVKPRDIIRSKLVNGFIWMMIAVGAAICAIAMIFASVVIFTDTTFADLSSFMQAFSIVPSGVASLVLLILPLYFVVSVLNGMLLYFAAIFFGSVIVRKNKLLASIGCILGANFAYSIVMNIIMFGVEIFAAIFTVAGTVSMVGLYNILFAVMTVVTAILAYVFYRVLNYMMEKKLNLA